MSVRVERILLVYEGGGAARQARVAAATANSGCALRRITHANALEKPEWTRYREGLVVPMEPATSEASDAGKQPDLGDLPCVVALTAKGSLVLLDGSTIAACQGSVGAFAQELTRSARRCGLSLA